MKERIFQGMHPHLRDCMTFLYIKEEVGYEEFLAAMYEAENEGPENKVLSVKAKAMSVEKIIDDKEQNDLRDFKQQIESLTMIMKSTTMGGVKWKGKGVSSPRKKEMFGNSPQNGLQGSPKTGKISLKPGQKPVKCY